MKIIFYINNLGKGGTQRVIVNFAEYLQKKEYFVTIVTTAKIANEFSISDKIQRIYSDIEPDEVSGNRVKNFILRTKKLRKIWIKEEPDLIISFIGKNNFMVLITALGLKIPIITSVRGEPREEYYNAFLRFLSKTLLGISKGLILQTEDAKKFFPRWIQKKSVILDNPLNPDFIDEYYEGTRKNEIVSVGRMDRNKNHKLIIDAFCKIAGEFPEIHLILYGDGEEREGLIEYVKKTKYQEQIFLPGMIRNVKKRIEKSKIFVLSSNTEGMPNSLMEALALGIPCISTDCPCGGPSALMRGKENGILVPVGDVDSMAEAMKRLLADESLREKYSRNAHKISEELHPEKINRRWEAYLLSVLGKEIISDEINDNI